jgi:hypothetical protein
MKYLKWILSVVGLAAIGISSWLFVKDAKAAKEPLTA